MTIPWGGVVPSKTRGDIHTMKRIPIVLLLILALLFVSCKNEEIETPEQNDDSGATVVEKGLVTIDLSDLKSGQSITKTVTGDVEFQLEGLDFSDGVVIIDGNFVSSKAVGKNGNENKSLFRRNDGRYIIVPDKNGKSGFNCSDIEISDWTTISFRKFDLDDDFGIYGKEYPGYTGIKEEFYYVDFSNRNDLNKSEVVFWVSGEGHSSVSVIDGNTFEREVQNGGIYDLSHSAFDGFGMDMYASLSEHQNSFSLFVLSPIALEVGESVAINDPVTIFKVVAKNDERAYKAVLKFESIEDYQRFCSKYLSVRTFARSTNSNEFRDDELVPFFDDENSRIEFEMGKVEKDFLFTIDASVSGITSFSSDVSISLELSSRNDLYSVLKDGAENVFKANDDSLKQVFAFKTINGGTSIVKKLSKKVMEVGLFHNSSRGYGAGASDEQEIHGDSSYCVVVTLDSKPQEGEELFSISPYTYEKPSCDFYFDFERNEYVYEGCDDCNLKGTRVEKAVRVMTHFLNGEYWSDESFGRYGRIGIFSNSKYLDALNENGIVFNSNQNTNYNNTQALAVYSADTQDVENLFIKMGIVGLHTKKNEIVVDVAVDGGETVKGIVLKKR